MKAQEIRQIAAGAARSYLRSMAIDPKTTDQSQALAALDDLARKDKDTIAATFYLKASDNQIKLFCKEWNK
jgi:hypothetical protein